MKKILFFTFLLLLGSVGFSQIRFGKLKCDSIQNTANSETAIIYRKGKMAVFNTELNRFLIKPTKGIILYLKEYELYAKADKRGVQISYFDADGKAVFQIEDDKELDVQLGGRYDEERSPLLFAFNTVYDYKNGREDKEVTSYFKVAGFKIAYQPTGLIIVNHAMRPILGEKEMDVDVILDSGYTKSGVYYLYKNKWVIPPVYRACEVIGDNILCEKQNNLVLKMSKDGFHGTLWFDNAYDQYQMGNKEVALLVKNCTTINQLDLKNLIGIDSISGIHSDYDDQSIFIAHKNGLQGLVKLELHGLIKKPSLSFKQLQNFSYTVLLPITYDFILLDYKGLKAICYKKNGANNIEAYEFIQKKGKATYEMNKVMTAEKELVFSINNAENMVSGIDLIADGLHYFKNMEDTVYILVKEVEPFYFYSFLSSETSEFENNAFGLKIENQNIIQQLFYESERINPFAAPLKSLLYPQEDSVIIDKSTGVKYVIYPPSIPGFEKSGLFDTELHQWFVNPNYKLCFPTADGYLLEFIDRSFSSYSDSDLRYSFLTKKNNFIFQNQTFEQVFADEENLKKCVADLNITELLPFPEKILPWSYTEMLAPYYYALDTDNKWSVIAPNKNGFSISPYPVFTQKEFVHYNPTYHFFFWLENDSIYIHIKNSTASVSQKTGKISLTIAQSEHEYGIILEESGRETIVKSRGFDKAEGISLRANIFVENNQLFVNDVASYNNLDLYWEYLEMGDDLFLESNEFLSYSTEMASIWKLENEIWTKKTPFYEFVEPISFGYLVKTSDYYEMHPSPEDIVDIQGRYILLDSNFKAMSFMDYFDFRNAVVYDFGIGLFDAQGGFLVGNDGKLITASGWDDFKLENGKIKAIKYDANLIETEGEFFIQKFKLFDF